MDKEKKKFFKDGQPNPHNEMFPTKKARNYFTKMRG